MKKFKLKDNVSSKQIEKYGFILEETPKGLAYKGNFTGDDDDDIIITREREVKWRYPHNNKTLEKGLKNAMDLFEEIKT